MAWTLYYERIMVSSRRTWGEEQSLVYQATIARAIDLLGEHPRLGRKRDDLFPGCRDIPVERHVMFYHQPADHELVVLRILHQRQASTGTVEAPTT